MALAICLIGLTAGCTMTRLAYDTAPALAGYEIDRFFGGLDGEQRALVDARVDEFHRWHRQTQLPAYAAFLRELDGRARANTPLEPAEVTRWRLRLIDDAWRPAAEQLAPALAELALTLRPAQIQRIRQQLADRNREQVREFLPVGMRAREEARAERLQRRVGWVLGDLDGEQKRELRQAAVALPSAEDAWWAEREARQAAFVGLLERIQRERPDPATATRWSREFLQALFGPSRDPARRALLERSQLAGDGLTAQMVNRATVDQRRRFSMRAQGWIGDFERLAAR